MKSTAALAVCAFAVVVCAFALAIALDHNRTTHRTACDASVYLTSQDDRSLAGHRIKTPGDRRIRMPPGGRVALVRHAQRWIVVGDSTGYGEDLVVLSPDLVIHREAWQSAAGTLNDARLPPDVTTLAFAPSCDRPLMITGLDPSTLDTTDSIDGREIILINEATP